MRPDESSWTVYQEGALDDAHTRALALSVAELGAAVEGARQAARDAELHVVGRWLRHALGCSASSGTGTRPGEEEHGDGDEDEDGE